MKEWEEEKERKQGSILYKHRLRFTCVTLFTVANNLSVTVVLVTRSSKVATAVGSIWTGARTTLTTGSFAQNWVTIVTIGTPAEMTKTSTQVNNRFKDASTQLERAICKKRVLNH